MDPAPKAPLEPAPAPAPRRRHLRAALILLAILAVLLLAAGAAAYRPYVRSLILREATRLGLALDFDDFELARGSVRLLRARCELAGVAGLRAQIDTLTVTLDGLAPTRINADGVEVTVEGSAADRFLALGAWSAEHPSAYRTPSESRRVRLTWSVRAGDPPWLTLTDGTLAADGKAATFRSPSATIEGLAVGALGAAWSADKATISIGVGKEILAEAPIRVEIDPTARPPTASAVMLPRKLDELAAPMGLGNARLPGTKNATVDGSARLTLGQHAGRYAVMGSVTVTIKGWIPPHPKELDGIVYGSSTAIGATFVVSEDRKKVTITEATVTAGAFKLKGKGAIDRDPTFARAVLDMDGAVACTDVARSATRSGWGDLLGELLGGLAQQAMQGSVAVHVHVEADTRDLAGAKLQHQIGVGCGLRLPKLL
jgi:ADP-dependent NAD(P)H-hydrate dehydratase / NAD(P)H-hydrate epimerase